MLCMCAYTHEGPKWCWVPCSDVGSGNQTLLSGRADLNWEMSGEMTQLVKTRSLTLSPGTYVLGEDRLLQTAL